MFNPIKEIDSRWETETRWLDTKSDGQGMKQKSKTETTTRKLTMAIVSKGHDTNKPILQFRGGPTGFESYYLEDINLKGKGDLCICAGTANRWPACYVDMPTVRQFIDEYKAAVNIA